MVKSLLLVGVGGQGTILVSKILSRGFVKEGYDVKMSEIHGMSQRGGSVTTQIRFGERVYSPSIDRNGADILIAFEKLEAARHLGQLKKDGILIVNNEEIYPSSVLSGFIKYPDGILETLEKKVGNIIIIEAAEIANKLGEPRAQNIVMLGAIVRALGLKGINWIELIRENLPEKVHSINIEAFQKGLSI